MIYAAVAELTGCLKYITVDAVCVNIIGANAGNIYVNCNKIIIIDRAVCNIIATY